MEAARGILIDAILSLPLTVAGIFFTYLMARPRIKFDHLVRRSRRPYGDDRFRIRLKAKNHYLRVSHLQVEAALRIKRNGRHTSIPVPLSRSEWFSVREPRDKDKWNFAPRLLLDEVEWARHLPPGMGPPMESGDLPSVMREIDAKLTVYVLATSSIFGIVKAFRLDYSADQMGRSAEPQ